MENEWHTAKHGQVFCQELQVANYVEFSLKISKQWMWLTMFYKKGFETFSTVQDTNPQSKSFLYREDAVHSACASKPGLDQEDNSQSPETHLIQMIRTNKTINLIVT